MERGILRSRIGLVLVIVGSVFLLTAGAAFAAGSSGAALVQQGALPPRSSESAGVATTGAITGTVPITGGQIIAGCIATFFNVEITEVVDYHAAGYGYGELAIAYALAEQSGESVDYILGLKESGMGWGEIAMDLGLHPSNRDRNLGRIVSGRVGISATIPGLSNHQPGPSNGNGPQGPGGPPDHAGPPDDVGPPDHAGPPDDVGRPSHAGPKEGRGKGPK